MGLISTRQYDRAMRFLGDITRTIRTSPPIQAVRKLHSQSFQDVQQVQSEIERYYNIEYRPQQYQSQQYQPHQSRTADQPSRNVRPALPSGRPQSLPPANQQPLGQLPPYRSRNFRPGTSHASQASRSQQAPNPQTSRQQQPRYPQQPEWQQRPNNQQNRADQRNRWERSE